MEGVNVKLVLSVVESSAVVGDNLVPGSGGGLFDKGVEVVPGNGEYAYGFFLWHLNLQLFGDVPPIR